MYIGLDVHKDFCQAAFLDTDGKLVREERFENSISGLAELAQATKCQKVVMESSTSSMHVYDALSETCNVKVAHPSRVKAIASARIKTDKIDARILAHLLRADLIPESYVPSKDSRQARLLVRQRASLVEVRTQIKNKIHALMTRDGVKIPFNDSFGKKTILFLRSADIGEAQRASLDSLLVVLETLDKQVKEFDKRIDDCVSEDKYAKLLATHPGVGRLTALAVSSEICDISRFQSHKKLASYFGLVPSVYQSGNTDRKGHITKQGNTLIRSLLIQCAWSAAKYSPRFRRKYEKLKKKTGSSQKAVVAIARTIATDMYFMLVRNEEYKEPKKERKGGKPVSLLGP